MNYARRLRKLEQVIEQVPAPRNCLVIGDDVEAAVALFRLDNALPAAHPIRVWHMILGRGETEIDKAQQLNASSQPS